MKIHLGISYSSETIQLTQIQDALKRKWKESELPWLLIRPHLSRTAIIYLYLRETKRLGTKCYWTTKPEKSLAFLLTKFSQPKIINNEVHRFLHTLNRSIKVDLSAPFPLNRNHALLLCNFLYFVKLCYRQSNLFGGIVTAGFEICIGLILEVLLTRASCSKAWILLDG